MLQKVTKTDESDTKIVLVVPLLRFEFACEFPHEMLTSGHLKAKCKIQDRVKSKAGVSVSTEYF